MIQCSITYDADSSPVEFEEASVKQKSRLQEQNTWANPSLKSYKTVYCQQDWSLPSEIYVPNPIWTKKQSI